jgi:hypothetical protein
MSVQYVKEVVNVDPRPPGVKRGKRQRLAQRELQIRAIASRQRMLACDKMDLVERTLGGHGLERCHTRQCGRHPYLVP